MNDFSVETSQDDRGRTVIRPRGELDLATHQELSQAITGALDAGQAHIVVDLTDTTFLDSTALGALISAHRRTDSLGGTFTVVCPDERLLRRSGCARTRAQERAQTTGAAGPPPEPLVRSPGCAAASGWERARDAGRIRSGRDSGRLRPAGGWKP